MANKLLSPSMSTADRKATLMENQHHVGKSVNKSNTQQTTGTTNGAQSSNTSGSSGSVQSSGQTKLLSPSMSTADRKATLMENQHHVGKSANKSNTQQTTGTSVGSGTRSTSGSTGTAKVSKTGTSASSPITVVTSLAREPAAVPMTNPTNGMVSPAAIKNSYSTLSGPAQREWVLDQFIGTFDGYGRQANAYEKMSEAAGQVYEALNKEFLEKYASTSDTSSREFMAYQEDNAREMNKVKADEKRWKALESEGR